MLTNIHPEQFDTLGERYRAQMAFDSALWTAVGMVAIFTVITTIGLLGYLLSKVVL